MDKAEFFKAAADAVFSGDEEKAKQVAKDALAAGIEPMELINEGFASGINKVGELFERGEMFLPDLIVSSEAMMAAVNIISEAMPQASEKVGKFIIGTVEGDIHDIGKGIVSTLLKVRGFEVLDLGRDVPISKFIEAVKEFKPDIVGSSALMTTTIVGQKELEEALRAEGLRDKVKTMIGGAVVTQRWCDKIGADAVGETAAQAVNKALELIGK